MASTSTSTADASLDVPSGQIIPARRTRAVVDDDGIDNDIPPKKVRTDAHPLSQKGSMFSIMGDMWRNFQTIIDTGYSRNDNSPLTTLPYRTRKMHELYRVLLKIAPSIPAELQARGPQGSMQIAKLLEKGRASQRSTDTYTLKSAIFHWHHFEPNVVINAKQTRGFNHPEFGRMLCPAGYDWSDPKVQEGLLNGSKTYPAGSMDWPVFLWENEQVDNDDLHRGFLRSTWIVKALQHILLGPSAALPKNANEDEASKAKANHGKSRKPRAVIHGVRNITTGAIAYGAALIHFAFSSQEIMGVGDGPGKFNYGNFHHSLVQEMDEGMSPAEREDLLSWYTHLVLGSQDDYCSADEDQENSDGRPHLSVAARMRAQKAATRAANSTTSGGPPLGHRNGN